MRRTRRSRLSATSRLSLNADVGNMKMALIAILFLAGAIAIGFRIAISLMPDLYIVPFEDVSIDSANKWGIFLADDLNIRVKVLGNASFPESAFNPDRRQYQTEAFADTVVHIRHNMRFIKSYAVFIGLLNKDMYPTTHSWRFCYLLNFLDGERSRISILSTARLSQEPSDDPQAYNTRLYKLFKRAIGFQLYGYNTSTNIASVMYGPELWLDEMGTEY